MVFCAICHLSASDLPFFPPAQSCYKHKLLKIYNYSIKLVSDFAIFCIIHLERNEETELNDLPNDITQEKAEAGFESKYSDSQPRV